MSYFERYLPSSERVLWQSEVRVSNEATGERKVKIGCLISIGILVVMFLLYLVVDVAPLAGSIFSSELFPLIFTEVMLWIVVLFSFFMGARASWRMYAKLRAWYPVTELAHYVVFIAITENHIVRKGSQVASRASITGLPFQTFVEEGPDLDQERTTSWVTRQPITIEKDVQTMDISALGRVQTRKMPRNSFLVNLSFYALDAPETSISRNFVAHTRLLVKARDMDTFITTLRTVNPTFTIEDQVSIKAMMKG